MSTSPNGSITELTSSSLAIYYQTPGATKHRAPTWVFLAAAQRAFAGSGELEDGTLALEDIVCTIASLIDQVSCFSFR